MMSLTRRAFTGSIPEVGSSRNSSSGRCSSARAKTSRICMPLENCPTRVWASLGEVDRLQQGHRVLGRAGVQRGEELQVLQRGELLVVVGQLEGDADALVVVAAPVGGVAAPHRRPAAVAGEQPGEDLLGGGLPGAAGAEEAEHLARGRRRSSSPSPRARRSSGSGRSGRRPRYGGMVHGISWWTRECDGADQASRLSTAPRSARNRPPNGSMISEISERWWLS